MTYRIEIKAETLAELAGKAYAFAMGVQTASAYNVSVGVGGVGTVTTTEVAEAAPENPTPAPKSAPAAEATESQPTTEEPSTTPAPSVEPLEKEAAVSNELNFDTDVAPIVLQVVKDKGKPAVQAILEEFGVERASQLDPARWPELIAQLKDAL
jgi:hypothetical protein